LETRNKERAKWKGWNTDGHSDGEGGYPPLVGNVDDDEGDGGGELPLGGRMVGPPTRTIEQS